VLGRWDAIAKRNDAVRVAWMSKGGASGITRETLTRKGAAVAKTAPSMRVDTRKTGDTPRRRRNVAAAIEVPMRRRNVAAAIEVPMRRRNVAAAIEVRLAKWILSLRRRGVADVVTTDEIMKRKKGVMQVAIVMPAVMSS
jgi:cell envelope opacity-associated protein A